MTKCCIPDCGQPSYYAFTEVPGKYCYNHRRQYFTKVATVECETKNKEVGSDMYAVCGYATHPLDVSFVYKKMRDGVMCDHCREANYVKQTGKKREFDSSKPHPNEFKDLDSLITYINTAYPDKIKEGYKVCEGTACKKRTAFKKSQDYEACLFQSDEFDGKKKCSECRDKDAERQAKYYAKLNK